MPVGCAAANVGGPLTIRRVDGRELVLVITIVFLVAYVLGIGGATAAAIRVGESWRTRPGRTTPIGPKDEGDVVLAAPFLPPFPRALRMVGRAAFPCAPALGLFPTRCFPWVA